jgi:chemotaxis family two-component system response regulator Rcp1
LAAPRIALERITGMSPVVQRAPSAEPVRVLLVEDNLADVRLMEMILSEGHLRPEVTVARDGVEAMAFLRGPGFGGGGPDLIFLDLNLPKKDGRQVLAEIKTDPRLRKIPVLIFTSSDLEEDILVAYDRHANCYLRKPVDLEGLRQAVRQIETFWFSLARLPGRPDLVAATP